MSSARDKYPSSSWAVWRRRIGVEAVQQAAQLEDVIVVGVRLGRCHRGVDRVGGWRGWISAWARLMVPVGSVPPEHSGIDWVELCVLGLLRGVRSRPREADARPGPRRAPPERDDAEMVGDARRSAVQVGIAAPVLSAESPS